MSAIDKQVFGMCTCRAARFTGLNDMYCGKPAVTAYIYEYILKRITFNDDYFLISTVHNKKRANIIAVKQLQVTNVTTIQHLVVLLFESCSGHSLTISHYYFIGFVIFNTMPRSVSEANLRMQRLGTVIIRLSFLKCA